MKKRNQISNEYKWDLTSYIKNENEIKRIFNLMEELPTKLSKYNGKLNNKTMLFERLNKFNNEFCEINILASYIGNSLNVNSTDTEMLKNSQKFDIIFLSSLFFIFI